MEPEAYDLLVNATNTGQIEQEKKHKYVSKEGHAQRIKNDKRAEKMRVERIWKEQEEILLKKEREDKAKFEQILDKHKRES